MSVAVGTTSWQPNVLKVTASQKAIADGLLAHAAAIAMILAACFPSSFFGSIRNTSASEDE